MRVRAIVDHGSILVPVRGVFEAIGAEVSYSPPHIVLVRQGNDVIAAFLIGRTRAIAGNRAVVLAAPPMRRDGRIYVPLRVVAEAAGASVAFRNHPAIVHIEPRPRALARSPSVGDQPADGVASGTALERSVADWRFGVAIATALCCLGCLVLTARRLRPILFAPVSVRRASRLPPPNPRPAAPAVAPADMVALSSVEASGEALVHKQIVRETRTIHVPIIREELVIEYAGDGGQIIIEGRTLEPGETVRIPLWEERVNVDVTKHVILKEDLVIGKRRNVVRPARPAHDARPHRAPAFFDGDVADGSPG